MGPSDLSVALGVGTDNDEIASARRVIAAAARDARKTFASWVRSASAAAPASADEGR